MFVLYFAIFAIVKAEVGKFPLGSLDVDVSMGNPLPSRYPLVGDDLVASANSKQLAEEIVANATIGGQGFPVLEPFYKDELPLITAVHALIKAEVKIRNLNVKGISTTTVGPVEARLKNGRFDASFTGRNLQIDADYEAKVRLGLLPLYFKGHATVWLNGNKAKSASGAVQRLYNGVKVLQLDGMKATAHVDDAQISIDKDLWESVTAVLSAKELVNLAAPSALTAVRTEVNYILRHFSVEAVMKYLSKNTK